MDSNISMSGKNGGKGGSSAIEYFSSVKHT